jgi:hypothetical protein
MPPDRRTTRPPFGPRSAVGCERGSKPRSKYQSREVPRELVDWQRRFQPNQGRTGDPGRQGGGALERHPPRHPLRLAPVVPGIEKVEDWEEHRDGVLDSLQPEGHLEEVLAERVALLSWRLHRVTRYETEAVALYQEKAEEDRPRGGASSRAPTTPRACAPTSSTPKCTTGSSSACPRWETTSRSPRLTPKPSSGT